MKRVPLDLQDESLARLDRLQGKTEAPSYADVIMNALRLYEAVIAEVDEGNTFMVKRQDGSTQEYAIF